MAEHAGYAGLVVVGRSVLDAIVRVYHNHDLIKSFWSGSLVVPISNDTLRYHFFVDAPELILEAARDPLVGLKVHAVGGVTRLTSTGQQRYGRVIMDAVAYAVPVAHRAAIGSGIQVGFAPNTAILDSLVVRSLDMDATVLFGLDPHHPLIRNLLQSWLREQLATESSFTHELFDQLVAEGLDPAHVVTRVFDDALAIAADVPGSTKGSRDAVRDIRKPNRDVAVALHASAILKSFARHKAELLAEVNEKLSGTVVHDIQVAFGADHLAVTGSATRHDPSPVITVTFQGKGKPVLVGERIKTQVYDLDADMPFWVDFLGIWIGALFPVGLFFSYVYADLIAGSLSKMLASAKSGITSNDAPRTLAFALPRTNHPQCKLRVESVAVSPAGIEVHSDFVADWLEPVRENVGTRVHVRPMIEGPPVIEVDRAKAPYASYKLVPHPGLYHRRDPRVRISWHVRRDDGVIIAWRDEAAILNATSISFDWTKHPAATEFVVACRVYRAEGSRIDHLHYETRRVSVRDRLDRTRPYVAWLRQQHVIWSELKEVDGKIERYATATFDEWRGSKIHRTDFGRCRFAGQYTSRVHDPKYGGAIWYMDKLPFDPALLVQKRRYVCDYCFFGGPDKTTPKPLPKKP